jgi:predicted permease
MMVSPEYFRTLHVPLLAGRSFTQNDTDRSLQVAIVNLSFAHRFFGKADPFGKRLHYGPASNPRVTIVGLVDDVHHDGLEKQSNPELFLPYAQNFLPLLVGVALRTDLPSAVLLPAIREKIAKVDPAQPIFDVDTMEHRLSESTGSRRTQTLLISSFALIALCLAAVGVYGVLSYAVTQTTREIGIRLALGAPKGMVLRSIVRRGAMLAIGGIVIGLAVLLATVRYLTTFLYQVKPLDWISFIGGSLVILALAILASYLPARRAAAVDPMTALRYE